MQEQVRQNASVEKYDINKLHVMHWNAQDITNRSAIAQLEHMTIDKQIDVIFIN